jgi:hypothetical protein
MVREPRGRGTSAVESQYQATASEDCNRPTRPNVSYSDYEVCRTVPA